MGTTGATAAPAGHAKNALLFGQANLGLRWFIVRVLSVTLVLAIPILGTSYVLVSSVTADIRTATTEHEELFAFAGVVELMAMLETVHRDLGDGASVALRRDVARTDTALARSRRTYAASPTIPATRAVWERWQIVWQRARRQPTIENVDRAIDALCEIGNELDDDSPLEFDPDFAVQNLVATTLRHSPRSVVAIGHTADAFGKTTTMQLDGRAIERVATTRAMLREPLDRVLAYIAQAISIRPELHVQLQPPLDRARTRTIAYLARVDRVLTTIRRSPNDGPAFERLARAAVDAQIDLWRTGRAEADRLVLERRTAQIQRRRIVVALSLAAVAFGALVITWVGRYLAHNARIELAAAKLESDRLRTELQQISIERALRLQEAQFRSVFENADLGIVIFDVSGRVDQCNGAVKTILGRRVTSVLENRSAQIGAFAGGCEPFTLEELHARADGSAQWLALTFSGVYDDGACQMVILLVRDTTEEKVLHAGLLHAASHDGLTQIANRSSFEQQLDALLSSPVEEFALIYVDLDKFKPVNDNFGHAAGDHVLVAAAERLRCALAGHDFCARLGGDEFAALVRGRLDPTTLASIAERIRASMAAPIIFGDYRLTVTASIGVANRGPLRATAAAIKAAADRALYAAKDAGGNGFRIDVAERDPAASAS